VAGLMRSLVIAVIVAAGIPLAVVVGYLYFGVTPSPTSPDRPANSDIVHTSPPETNSGLKSGRPADFTTRHAMRFGDSPV
jgi:hypothetical protein